MACVCAMVTVVDNASSRGRNWCGCRLVECTYEKGGVSEPFIIYLLCACTGICVEDRSTSGGVCQSSYLPCILKQNLSQACSHHYERLTVAGILESGQLLS